MGYGSLETNFSYLGKFGKKFFHKLVFFFIFLKKLFLEIRTQW